jgi:hypothetical protein
METESLWEKVKQSLRDGATTAAEKAEHYGKLSRARLDIARTRHAIHDAFTELGGQTYNLLEQETDTVVGQDGDIKDQIQTIKDLEAQLQSQEEEFAALQGSTQPTDAPESEPE